GGRGNAGGQSFDAECDWAGESAEAADVNGELLGTADVDSERVDRHFELKVAGWLRAAEAIGKVLAAAGRKPLVNDDRVRSIFRRGEFQFAIGRAAWKVVAA